jgi:hypothetical protein
VDIISSILKMNPDPRGHLLWQITEREGDRYGPISHGSTLLYDLKNNAREWAYHRKIPIARTHASKLIVRSGEPGSASRSGKQEYDYFISFLLKIPARILTIPTNSPK